MSAPLTPMQMQWQQLKAEHPARLLAFRLGDFYEMFWQDAHDAAACLKITLTNRAKVPMAGFPAHAEAHYFNQLLAAGYAVAIVENTAPLNECAKREVTCTMDPPVAV